VGTVSIFIVGNVFLELHRKKKKKKNLSILREHLALKIKTEGIVTNKAITYKWPGYQQNKEESNGYRSHRKV
jgi:hypothetical protein